MKHLYYFYPEQLKNFTDPSEVESNLVTFLKWLKQNFANENQ